MGAEYACGAAANGYSTQVIYLTCSGPSPQSEVSRTRQAEAVTAWSTIHVPKQNLFFADLPQSKSISGPSTFSEAEINVARELFKKTILSLPERSAVIVPADGESHIDHATVRLISLEAILTSKRDDLFVYECPEYNDFLSLVHCPKKTLRSILRSIPLVHRLVKPYVGSANYINGCPGFVFRDMPTRLARKKELLSYFKSQNPDLLVQYFGYETPYRKVAPSGSDNSRRRPFTVSAFGGSCDWSALAFGATLLTVAFLTTHEIVRLLTLTLSTRFAADKYLATAGVVAAAVYFGRVIRRSASLETCLFVWAGCLGLISAAL
jgi:hypothetical protein